MKKVNKKTALAIKTVAGKMADLAYGASSMWGMHQAVEPKKPERIKK